METENGGQLHTLMPASGPYGPTTAVTDSRGVASTPDGGASGGPSAGGPFVMGGALP